MSWQERIEDITREGDPDQLVSAEAVAALLAVSPRTVRRMRRDGRLRGVVLGSNLIRFRLGDVRQLIREKTQ